MCLWMVERKEMVWLLGSVREEKVFKVLNIHTVHMLEFASKTYNSSG